MNAKKIATLSDEAIKKVRDLTAQKAKIDSELNILLGIKERKPRQQKLPLDPPKVVKAA
jgi:hypothetical protein